MDNHISISRIYVPLHGEKDFVDMIKQIVFRCEGCPALSYLVPCNHRDPGKKKAR